MGLECSTFKLNPSFFNCANEYLGIHRFSQIMLYEELSMLNEMYMVHFFQSDYENATLRYSLIFFHNLY